MELVVNLRVLRVWTLTSPLISPSLPLLRSSKLPLSNLMTWRKERKKLRDKMRKKTSKAMKKESKKNYNNKNSQKMKIVLLLESTET
jgi:hypothetical protein